MGAVYKAMHTRFKEVRALKVMSPELASDVHFVRRFEQEAVIARKLQHVNAVRVEDIDEAEDGRPFIVMEFIEGRSLADVIEQEAPMAVPRVCSIIKQAAAALDAAHALGLIHRDIKPSNIALIAAGTNVAAGKEQVKVLDFGIAKVRDAQPAGSPQFTRLTMTGTGMLIGTPAYMSPEQSKGLRGDLVDGRSDLYSLGVVMYEMLSGDLPFKASTTVEQLAAVINTPPRPVREIRPELGIPEPIDAVLMRCLAKDPAMRPASGQALIEELESAGKRAAPPRAKRSTLPSARTPTPDPTPSVPDQPHEAESAVPPPLWTRFGMIEPVPTEPVVREQEPARDKWMLWIAVTIVAAILGTLVLGWVWTQPIQ